MSFQKLFIRNKKAIGGIELDAVLVESHDNQVRLTKNPIELGANVTDHAVIEPKRIFITAQVSDTPLGLAAFGQIVDLVTGLFGTSTSQNITRSNAAYNAIVQLMELREPIEVQTKLRLYQNMIITNLAVTQDKDSSRIVLMNLTLEELLIVESQIVQLSSDQLESGSAREQGTSAEKKGRQEPVNPEESKEKSVLKSIDDWIFG